jgi:hypothetical protein
VFDRELVFLLVVLIDFSPVAGDVATEKLAGPLAHRR